MPDDDLERILEATGVQVTIHNSMTLAGYGELHDMWGTGESSIS